MKGRRFSPHFAYLSLFTGGMLLCCGGEQLPSIFRRVGDHGVVLTSWIGFEFEREAAAPGRRKAFLTTRMETRVHFGSFAPLPPSAPSNFGPN